MKTANISFNVQAVQTGASDKISMTKDKSFEKIISKNMDRSSDGSRQTNSGKMNPAKEIKDGFDSHKCGALRLYVPIICLASSFAHRCTNKTDLIFLSDLFNTLIYIVSTR